ncbi:MAG: zf-HC2 domain-containing protein [Chloroflexi bacterium]|nr:zf-HC2 domain-containing protein [Chloroflexota bacterium]
MNAHVDELLARQLEEALSGEEYGQIERHLAVCARCRTLASDLQRSGRLIRSAPPRQGDLPPLDLVRVSPRPPFLAFAGAVVTVVVAALIGTTLYEYRQGLDRLGSAAAPSASAPPAMPGALLPSASPTGTASPVDLLIAYPRVLDRVPGGGTVYTNAYGSFDVRSPSGSTVAHHEVRGIAISPTFDGHDRVAYWRQEAPGGDLWELLIWEIRSGSIRVAMSLQKERPSGEIIWDAAGDQLIMGVRDGSGNGRIVAVDASTGKSSDIAQRPGPPRPLFADQRTLVAISGQDYEVIDMADGRTISRDRIPQYGQVGANDSGVFFGLVTAFEAASGPLYIWDARSPAMYRAEINERGTGTPLFRPRSTELLFVRGSDVWAIDYDSKLARKLIDGTTGDTPALIAFDASGEHLLFRDGRGLVLVNLRTGQQVVVKTDQSVVDPLGLVPH